MFKIRKEFKFDAGHRVYTQNINETLACDNKCVCRHLHGHEYKVEVHLSSDNLNNQGMVTDFKHLNWFKKWLDETFDHKFIFGIDDPFLGFLINSYFKIYKYALNIDCCLPLSSISNVKTGITSFEDIRNFVEKYEFSNIWIPTVDIPSFIFDIYDGIVITNFVPTAENLARFFYELIKQQMINNSDYNLDKIFIDKIIVWETSKSYAEYRG